MSLATNLAQIPNITTGYIPRATATGFVNAMIFDNGTNIGIGTTSPAAALHITNAIGAAPAANGVMMGVQSNYAVIHLNAISTAGSLIDFSTSGTDYKGRIEYDNTNDWMRFGTNGAERMRITSAGRLGLGTTNPSYLMEIAASSAVVGVGLIINDTNGKAYSLRSDANEFIIRDNSASADRLKLTSSGALVAFGSSMNIRGTASYLWFTESGVADKFLIGSQAGSGDLVFRSNSYDFSTGTERLRITGAGNLQFNYSNTSAAYVELNQATNQDGGIVWKRNIGNKFQQTLNNSDGMQFYSYGISTTAFVINQNGSASLYGALTQNASDRRLKNNIQNIPNALDKINSINGVTFEWDNTIYKTDKTNDVGVIAQEIQSVLPEAVTLAPFDTNDNGVSKSGDNYLTVYYEKIIPLLIEGIKEQQEQINSLKAQFGGN